MLDYFKKYYNLPTLISFIVKIPILNSVINALVHV